MRKHHRLHTSNLNHGRHRAPQKGPRMQRIQRSRRKGWRLPPSTHYVGRPTRWGNPFRVGRDDEGYWTVSHGGNHWVVPTQMAAYRLAIELYAAWCTSFVPDIITALRDKNLACWCPLDRPCHADVLLRIANGPLEGQPRTHEYPGPPHTPGTGPAEEIP
jgi:hypothetical protein